MKFKILIALVVLAIARFYPDIIQLFHNNENSTPVSDMTNGDVSNRELSLEKQIIQSWKSLISLPDRNLNRNLKVAIG